MERKSVKKYVKIVILLAISLIIFPFLLDETYVKAWAEDENAPIVMETEDVSVVIRYGLDNQARYGRNTLFSADIVSKTLSGRYKLNLYFGNSENKNVKYGVSVTLKQNENTKIEFAVPMYQEVLNVRSELTDAEGNTLVERVNKFHVTNYGTYKLIGILTDAPERMSYLSAFGSKCFYLDQSNFPSDKLGLDILDVIVIDGFDCDILVEEQIKALQDFVKEGGTLVIGTGDRVENLRAFVKQGMISLVGMKQAEGLSDVKVHRMEVSFLDDERLSNLIESINSYETTRISTLNKMKERSETYGIDLSDAYVGESMDRILPSNLVAEPFQTMVAEFSIVDGSILYQAENAQTLVQKKIYDQGNIIVFSFPLAENVFVIGENAASYEIPSLILSNLSGAYQQELEMESYGSIESMYSYGVINIAENAAVPTLWIYLITLAVYCVLIGPVLFLALRKRKANKYLWGIVPIISLVFVVIVYAEGANTRIVKPFVSYLNIDTYDPSEGMISGKTAFDLSFPQNTQNSYLLKEVDQVVAGEVKFPQYEIYYSNDYLMQRKYMDLSRYQLGITKEEEGILIESNNTPSFYQNYLEASYKYESAPLVRSTVHLDETGLSGTIENISEDKMKNSFLYCEGILTYLGELEPGQVINIENAPYENLFNIEGIYYSELINNMLVYDDDDNVIPSSGRKNKALREIVEAIQREKGAAYLITFPDALSVKNPIAQLAENKGSYGTNVRLIKVDVSYTDGNNCYVPDIDSYMELTQEAYEYLLYFRYMLSDTIVVKYHFPKTDDITKIVVSGVFNRIIEHDNSSNLGNQIYFYNNETKEYELVFDLKNWKPTDESTILQITGEELKKYLTGENVLKVRYETGGSMDDVAVLPRISFVKEVSYATD